MGSYNPYAPAVLGEEWVPIREEELTFSPDLNTYEQGYSFTLPTATQVGDARFYIPDWPAGVSSPQAFQAAIYPKGAADSAGPIKSVIIPCNSAATTGAGSSGGLAEVSNPSDNRYITIAGNVSTTVGFFFNVDAYPFLNGKRITNVEFLYTLGISLVINTSIALSSVTKNLALYSPVTFLMSVGILDGSQTFPVPVQAVSLGDATPIPTATFITNGTDRLPWRFQDLQKLQFNNPSRAQLTVTTNSFSTSALDTLSIGYAALRVSYCEERRVAIGGGSFGSGNSSADWQLGMNKVTMRSCPGYVASPVLPAGEYDLVLSSPNPPSFDAVNNSTTGYTAPVNALRELFSIPTHPGLRVAVPQNDDDVFTQAPTSVLPQLSLHASGSGATLTQPHSYGRQAVAPVYGAITATQEIDPAPGQATTYPQVRFYARRFGDTKYPLVLSSASFPSSTASIAPADFDLLDEIIDGWKEVTLRFATPPTFIPSGAVVPWQWSSTNEAAGSRWEVLGARAPAVSGIGGNYVQEVPSAQRLGPATYYAETGNGTTTALTWQAPPASGVAEDASADAVLVFSQDPPTVSTFAVTGLSQSVTGIGQLCGQLSGCDITGINYHRLTWSNATGIVGDRFTRTTSGGWGAATSGQTWTVNDGTAANFTTVTTSVSGYGQIATPNTSAAQAATNTASLLNSDQQVLVTLPAVAVTNPIGVYLLSRVNTVNTNMYAGRFAFNTDGSVSMGLEKWVATVFSGVGGLTTQPGLTYTAGSQIWLRFQTNGSLFRMKAWAYGQPEPSEWTVIVTDTSLTAAGVNGIRTVVGSGNANPTNLQFTSYTDQWGFGAFELQRKDAVDNLWQTIMLSTSPLTWAFNDYEARVGALSTYRIRARNVYDFVGTWSAEQSNTIAYPGVITSAATSPRGTLIFTMNEVQSGGGNLAYVETWDRSPMNEDFDLPEADTVTLQRMYGKDFFTAFHPAERGGMRFTRSLLIRNAAVSTPVIDNIAQAIRDLAWRDASYVCVRTENGDRWYSNVTVPDVMAKRARQIHIVQVEITEVTDTPTQVNAG